MTEYVFKLPVEPVAQMRPRFTRRPYVHAYDPVKVKRYKEALAWHAQDQWMASPATGPIKLQLRFFRPVQKSLSKTEHARRLSGAHRPTLKPDVDNYIKSTLDGLNGVIWTDDNEIVSIRADKFYSEDPRVEVYVEKLRPEDSRWMEE